MKKIYEREKKKENQDTVVRVMDRGATDPFILYDYNSKKNHIIVSLFDFSL
jgi:hypothetical protein